MSKVIKIFFGTISAVILAFIILPLAVWLLLMVPAVQNFAVRKAAEFASEKLGTTVSIDRIHLRLINSAEIEGFYVEDLEGDTLMYIGRLKVGVYGPQLIRGRIMAGDVAIADGFINLRQDADSTMNIKKIIDRLKPDEPRNFVFRMTASSVSVENMRLRLKKYVVREREYGMNFDDFEFYEMNLRGEKVSIANDSISMNLRHISVKEKNGFSIDEIRSPRMNISSTGLRFDDLHIRMPDSNINAEWVRFTYTHWRDFADFINRVTMDARIYDSDVSFRTIGFFAPKQRGWQSDVHSLTATLYGTVGDMGGRIESLTIYDTDLAADYHFTGIPDVRRTDFNFDIRSLSTSGGDIRKIVADVSPKNLNDSIGRKLASLGSIGLRGRFDGTLKLFTAEVDVATDRGNLQADLYLSPSADNSTAVNGSVSVDSFDLGTLLGKELLGTVSLTASVDGRLRGESIHAVTSARVSRFDFNGYRYSDILMNGTLSDRNFKGAIASSDPNIDFDFDGMVDLNDSVPRYDFAMRLHNADLFKLGFNRRDSVSVLRSNIDAVGSGTRFDNLNADITFGNLTYVSHVDTLTTGRMTITGRNSERSKYVALSSDFMDAEFRSQSSYSDLYNYFTGTLYNYLPSLLQGRPREQIDSRAHSTGVGDWSIFSVNIKDTENIVRALVPGLLVAEGSKVMFMFNPYLEKFSLTANSDYIERGDMFISNLDINSRNESDSISLFVRADEVYAARLLIPNLSVIGGVRDNRIYAATHFTDHEKDRSALLGLNATLGRNAATGIPQLRLWTSPSNIRYGSESWDIFGSAIIDSTRTKINTFRISSDDQSLRAYGDISAAESDTLHVALNNFDLSVLTQITEVMGFYFGGTTSGHVDLVSLKNNGRMQAAIGFDEVTINGTPIPAADFVSRWDFQRERAGFLLTERATADTVVVGYFSPADKSYGGDVRLRGFDMNLLTPFFDGIMSNTHGRADADVRLAGSGRDVRFDGTAMVRDMTTTIDYLGVPYSIPEAPVIFSNNVMSIDKAVVYDPVGNTALTDLRVSFENFRNIAYNVDVIPRNLMVLNTTERDNDFFYGRAFANGTASIRGNRTGLKMDITATTSDNSDFSMVLLDKEDISDADFITFITPRRVAADTSDYGSRREQILSRNARRGRRRGRVPSMDINMTINAQPNLLFHYLIDPITGHSIHGRGNGTIYLKLDPISSNFSMIGDYQITEGSYNFNLEGLIEKSFTVEPGGYIQWIGDPLDALLDISAVYRLKTSLRPIMEMAGNTDNSYNVRIPVDCRVMLTDRLLQPSITFNIAAPTADPETQNIIANMLNTQEMMATQFFFLLAAGSFYADTGFANIGASAGTETAFSFLSNQISNWISSDKFNVGIRYRRDETTGNEFGIDFSQELFSNRLLLEVGGNYIEDYDGVNQSISQHTKNFTGDFYITFLVDKAGSLKTKVFSRTIDRFDENQGLQETGVGIYYNEYFNNFGDIVRNLRERFTGEKRRKRQRAQREADLMEEQLIREESDIPIHDPGEETGSAEVGQWSIIDPGSREPVESMTIININK